LSQEQDPHQVDLERVSHELATVKVTPGHHWCATCGANKPAHSHPCPECGVHFSHRLPSLVCVACGVNKPVHKHNTGRAVTRQE